MNLSDVFGSIFFQGVELLLLVSLFTAASDQYIKCLDIIRDKVWGAKIPIFVLRCLVGLMLIALYCYAINVYVDNSVYKAIILLITIPGAYYYGHRKNWETSMKFYFYLGAWVLTLIPF